MCGEELVREGAYDFLLFSLPDNDFHSHRHGPEAQVDSIAKADAMFTRLVDAGGGLDEFLSKHAVVLTADHSQTPVEHALPLADELAEDWAVLQPNTDRPEEAEIAVSPTSRAGAVYILDTGRRHAATHERVRIRLHDTKGVDLIAWLASEDGSPVLRQGVGLPAPRPWRWWSSATASSSASTLVAGFATSAGTAGRCGASPRRSMAT